jgi:hypothetical protein
MAARYTYPVGSFMPPTRSHRSHTATNASCISSSASSALPVTMNSARSSRSCSVSNNASKSPALGVAGRLPASPGPAKASSVEIERQVDGRQESPRGLLMIKVDGPHLGKFDCLTDAANQFVKRRGPGRERTVSAAHLTGGSRAQRSACRALEQHRQGHLLDDIERLDEIDPE